MNKNHNHIHLFGDPLENFYILGKKDKSSFEAIYHQISMLCARNQSLSKVLKITTELSAHIADRPTDTHYHKNLEAYASGLERSVKDITFSLLLPEIVASFNKWVPDLRGLIPGCSSLFMKDPQTQDILHGRILDYALSGPFENFERSILYEFTSSPKVFSYSTTGMPFPSLSSMNEHGLSLALHYKHGQYFNQTGDSIFQITNLIINQCTTVREAVKLLKKQESISYWGIYLCDKSGEVASVDIRGNELYQERFDLADHDHLYFNNRPILKQNDQKSIQPFGNANQCKMRRDSLKSQIKKLNLEKAKDPLVSLVKTLGKPQVAKANTAKNWNLSTTNTSSIQLYGFNLCKNRTIEIPGVAPKYFLGDYHDYQDIFGNIKFKHKEAKKKPASNYIIGQRYLSQYQSSFDLGDIPKAYHYIQMAICHLKGHPEYFIAKFYYTVLQYLYESDKRDFSYIYDDFKSLNDKLPKYLEDHRQLFLMRTGKLIGHKIEDESHKIEHPELQKYYLDECKLNSVGLKALKHLIFPRIEILDIIYSY